MSIEFKITFMTSCTLKLRHCQRGEYFTDTKTSVKTTIKGKLQNQSQNIGLDLVTFI